ncbi:hypothetical protein BC941DRAFT_507833 [Chlamydoabsidia padenii]|nr:hypothetical protein BC941DRAFT_507833 [Chlamydoabsidia padenii]
MSTSTKPAKRFSLASFTRSFQSNPSTTEAPSRRRLEKTQSMYIKPSPTSPPLIPSAASQAPRQSFQEELPKKSHTQHIKKTIRRSLSVIMYANPSSSDENKKSHLVPVLVTPNVADPMILMEEKKKEEPVRKTSGPKRILEYDNTVTIEPGKEDVLILWQGYGYTLGNSATLSGRTSSSSDDSSMPPTPTATGMPSSVPYLDSFDQDRWANYKGLIHPLHLFDLDEDICWSALTVTELRRYYDNYGSMMLKQRKWRQQQQTLQYHPTAIMT